MQHISPCADTYQPSTAALSRPHLPDRTNALFCRDIDGGPTAACLALAQSTLSLHILAMHRTTSSAHTGLRERAEPVPPQARPPRCWDDDRLRTRIRHLRSHASPPAHSPRLMGII